MFVKVITPEEFESTYAGVASPAVVESNIFESAILEATKRACRLETGEVRYVKFNHLPRKLKTESYTIESPIPPTTSDNRSEIEKRVYELYPHLADENITLAFGPCVGVHASRYDINHDLDVEFVVENNAYFSSAYDVSKVPSFSTSEKAKEYAIAYAEKHPEEKVYIMVKFKGKNRIDSQVYVRPVYDKYEVEVFATTPLDGEEKYIVFGG